MREPLTRQQVEVMRGNPYLLATEEALIATIDAERARADRLEAQCAEMLVLLDKYQQEAQTRWKDWDAERVNAFITRLKVEARDILASSGQSLRDVVEKSKRLATELDDVMKNQDPVGPEHRLFPLMVAMAEYDAALSRWKDRK